MEYTKEFIAEAKEHVTAGGSTVEATEMLDKVCVFLPTQY